MLPTLPRSKNHLFFLDFRAALQETTFVFRESQSGQKPLVFLSFSCSNSEKKKTLFSGNFFHAITQGTHSTVILKIIAFWFRKEIKTVTVTVTLENAFKPISRRYLESNENEGVAVDAKTVMVMVIILISQNFKMVMVTIN